MYFSGLQRRRDIPGALKKITSRKARCCGLYFMKKRDGRIFRPNYLLFYSLIELVRRSQPISRVLSWAVIPLGYASPRTSSSLPGSDADHTNGSLFGLAPGGVYPATHVATRAVRSYRTISPLPPPKRVGGIFSVALSVGSRPPGVTWHPVLWSPDFPPACASDCLAGSSASAVWSPGPHNSR